MLVGLELLQQTIEKVKQIQERMKSSHNSQKSYAYQRRKPLKFAVGYHVFTRVTRSKGVGRDIR